MKNVYSYGIDSPLKIKLTPEQADAYNFVIQGFFDAQKRFAEIHNRKWNGNEPLEFHSSVVEKMKTYNQVAGIITRAIKRFGRPVLEEDLPEDFLVKN